MRSSPGKRFAQLPAWIVRVRRKEPEGDLGPLGLSSGMYLRLRNETGSNPFVKLQSITSLQIQNSDKREEKITSRREYSQIHLHSEDR